MSNCVQENIIPVFQGLVTGLIPFANSQNISLQFRPQNEQIHSNVDLKQILSEASILLIRIISFTPALNLVKVSLESSTETSTLRLVVENTGIDLSKLREISSSVQEGLIVEGRERGTRFIITFPLKTDFPFVTNVNICNTHYLETYPNYYTSIIKRLSNYFCKNKRFDNAISSKVVNQSAFINKVNETIYKHISNSEFKVNHLANAMALSRTQLYRKIKFFTQKSPQNYLRLVRLERARFLLQSDNGRLNISEVSYEVGFSSLSHFTRSFHKEFGLCPRDAAKSKM